MDPVIIDLNNWLDKQDEESSDYLLMLEALRDEPDPENYEDIIEAYGWGDVDLAEILEDI